MPKAIAERLMKNPEDMELIGEALGTQNLVNENDEDEVVFLDGKDDSKFTNQGVVYERDAVASDGKTYSQKAQDLLAAAESPSDDGMPDPSHPAASADKSPRPKTVAFPPKAYMENLRGKYQEKLDAKKSRVE